MYKFTIDVWATSNVFKKGHVLRLEVSSSNFPRFDRNLNTGGKNYDETTPLVAENAVYHTTIRASNIIMPVIP